MVTACKAYITDGGTVHVWDQETPLVLKKIQVCGDILIFLKYSFHHLAHFYLHLFIHKHTNFEKTPYRLAR